MKASTSSVLHAVCQYWTVAASRGWSINAYGMNDTNQYGDLIPAPLFLLFMHHGLHLGIYRRDHPSPPSSGSLVKCCGPRCGQADPWRKTHENEPTHIIWGGETSQEPFPENNSLLSYTHVPSLLGRTLHNLAAVSPQCCKWLERRDLTFDHQKNAREWGNVSWHLFIPFPFPCLSCWILWHWQIPVPFSTQLRPIARLFRTSSPLRVPMETHWQAPMWFRARWDPPSWLLS